MAALRQSLPRLAYLMPDFHNPAGHLMSAPDRAALATAAAAAGTRLVIDETFAELSLGDGEPALPAPLAAWDPAGQVITIGSMSKAFWAGLRVGWVRADPGLAAQLQAARGPSDLASPVVEQLAAAWLLERADRLLPARRASLTRRRDVLAAALAEHLPAWSFRLPAAGCPCGPGWTRRSAARWPRPRNGSGSGSCPAPGSAPARTSRATCGCRSPSPKPNCPTRPDRLAAARASLGPARPVPLAAHAPVA